MERAGVPMYNGNVPEDQISPESLVTKVIATTAFQNFQPKLYELFDEGYSIYNTDFEDDFVRDNYGKAENVSVDYAIMEKSDNVYVLPAEFDWNDLGTWGSVYDKIATKEDENVQSVCLHL